MVKHSDDMPVHKIVKSFISGGLAGVASKTTIAPIERIKFLYLTRSAEFRYRTAISDLVYIVRHHGLLNLWRGNSMNVLRVFPHAAIDFAVFDYLRRRFYKKSEGLMSQVVLFWCGALAGCASISVTQPLQFLRVRMAMEKDTFVYGGGIRSTWTKVYRSEGIRGFYTGYFASLFGIIMYHGTGFFIFTKLKQQTKKRYPQQFTKWYTDFIIGTMCSMGQFLAYPLDMIKKRMQGQTLLVQRGEIPRALGYADLIAKMRGQGIRSFYKGFTVNLFKTPLAMAVSWTIKNNLNRMLDDTYDF